MHRGVPATIAVLVAVALGVAACSGDNKSTSTSSAGGKATGGVAVAADTGKATGQPVTASVARSIVSNATISVNVADVAKSVASVGDLATQAGGVVASSQQGDSNSSSATVTIKVPSSTFQDVLRQVAALGRLRERRVTTDDVTDQVVDLDARISASRASVDRLTQLIGRGANVGEVVAAEAELTKRTGELEGLEGQLRVLQGTVDLSTIVVDLRGPTASVSDGLPSFLDGFRGGWHALVGTGAVVLVVLGALLPWLPVIGLLVAGAVLVGRVRKRRLRALVGRLADTGS